MVDTPFVSEEFQRAYRNNFPSQVSSGRDLHVSDVVIPIVDFTPTTAGASLALELRNCINKNSVQNRITTATTTTVANQSGFINITADLLATTSSSRAEFEIFDGSTALSIMNINSGTDQSNRTNFIVYLTSTDSLRVTTGSTADLSVMTTPVADINGNLINPNGYNPQ